MRALLALLLALASAQAWSVNPPPSEPQRAEHQGTWAGIEYLDRYVADNRLSLSSYTDTTDCTSAGLASALSAGSGGNVRVNCDITLSGALTVPADTTVFSSNGSLITSPTSSDYLQFSSRSKALGLSFTGYNPIRLVTSTGQTGVVFAANYFYDIANIAVYHTGTADNSYNTYIRTERNKFRNCAYGIYVVRTSYGTFSWNDFRESTSRNIQFVGGSYNYTENNYIQDGITGINLLLSASFGNTSSMIGHVIRRNEIYNTTEEAIGGDLQGGEAANIGTLDQFAINATPTGTFSSSPTLQVPRTTTFEPFNYYVIFYTGTLKGRYFKLAAGMTDVGGSPDSVTFKIQNSALRSSQWNPGSGIPAVGDEIAIGIVVADTKIQDNIVFTGPTTNVDSVGVSIYGSMFDSVVSGNIIGTYLDTDPAIKLTTLCGMVTSSKFANNNSTGNRTCGIIDGNVIANNTIKSGTIRLRGKTYQTQVNTQLDGQVYSNPVYNNLVSDVVNDKWDGIGDVVLETSTPPSDDAVIGTEYSIGDYASSLKGSTEDFDPDAYCLAPDSPLLATGTYIGAYVKGYDNESLTNPPPIGARGLCNRRTASVTRAAQW